MECSGRGYVTYGGPPMYTARCECVKLEGKDETIENFRCAIVRLSHAAGELVRLFEEGFDEKDDRWLLSTVEQLKAVLEDIKEGRYVK